MDIKIIEFKMLSDQRGSLVVVEGSADVPFEIKRVYWILSSSPPKSRGFHAHHTLKQVLISLRGSCKVLLTNGDQQVAVKLEAPNRGVLIEPLVWHELHSMTDDCILLALADGVFDEADYIRSYTEYLEVLYDTVPGFEDREQSLH